MDVVGACRLRDTRGQRCPRVEASTIAPRFDQTLECRTIGKAAGGKSPVKIRKVDRLRPAWRPSLEIDMSWRRFRLGRQQARGMALPRLVVDGSLVPSIELPGTPATIVRSVHLELNALRSALGHN